MQFNIHGNIAEHNLDKRYEETKKYGPIRVKISRDVVMAMDQLGWVWSLEGGNLMAAYRDGGKMLPHDDDFDFWVFTEEINLETAHEQKVQFLTKML